MVVENVTVKRSARRSPQFIVMSTQSVNIASDGTIYSNDRLVWRRRVALLLGARHFITLPWSRSYTAFSVLGERSNVIS